MSADHFDLTTSPICSNSLADDLQADAAVRNYVDTSAVVTLDGNTTVVTIRTSGDDLERVRVTMNGGIMFDDWPEFYIDPGFRDCPYCRIRAAVLNYRRQAHRPGGQRSR